MIEIYWTLLKIILCIIWYYFYLILYSTKIVLWNSSFFMIGQWNTPVKTFLLEYCNHFNLDLLWIWMVSLILGTEWYLIIRSSVVPLIYTWACFYNIQLSLNIWIHAIWVSWMDLNLLGNWKRGKAPRAPEGFVPNIRGSWTVPF